METRPATIAYQPGLDGLRAVAVAGVLLFHGGHLRGGFLGVDAFFVLSGFLITSLLLAEVATTNTVSFRRFYLRRLRRLLPALAVVMLFVATYAAVAAQASELRTIRRDGIATMLYFANWRAIASGGEYWALFRAPSPLNHTWSLAIEEQFYVVWPALVWFASRAGDRVRRVRWLAIFGIVASSCALAALFEPGDTARAYFGTDTRVASMFVGAVLATLPLASLRRRWSRRALELLAIAAIGGLTWAWMVVDGQDAALYRGGMLTQAIAVGVVIAATVHPERMIVARTLSFAPLRALGLISYGVYLWHWPIYVWLDAARVGHGGWWLLIVRVAATVGAATLSYALIERPIRHGWPSARAMWIATPIAIATVCVVVMATTTGYQSQALADERPDPIPVTQPPKREEPTTPTRVLVVGNSVAFYLAEEGFPNDAAPGAVVLNRGVVGCRLLRDGDIGRSERGPLNNDGPPCLDTQWKEAVARFQPDLVLRVFSSATNQELRLDDQWVGVCDPPYASRLRATFAEEAAILSKNGATVVFVTAATPSYPFLEDSWYRADQCFNDIVRELPRSGPRIEVADLHRWMCPIAKTPCPNQREGVTLRPDLVHFRGDGAQLVMRWILTHHSR